MPNPLILLPLPSFPLSLSPFSSTAPLLWGAAYRQLPYMKELVNAGAKARRGVLTLDGFLSYEGDVAAITFADPVREKARQLRLTREAAVSVGVRCL